VPALDQVVQFDCVTRSENKLKFACFGGWFQ